MRNRGTIGGSVSHADPWADYLPVLVASGAIVVLESAGGRRQLQAGEFFVDLMFAARQPAELVTKIRVPKLRSGLGGAYLRLPRVEGSSRS